MNKRRQLEHTLHHFTSPKRSHTFWGLLAVVAVCFGFIWLKHSDWLRHPNDRMLSNSPDGFKNYMTSVWHVRYDSSYVHYEGMNYPFGEHVLFTDNQPIFSAAMQWWSANVSDLTGHTVGVINLFQVISMLMGCGILFLLFRKLHLPVWYAGLVSLGMLFLSPQWGRFEMHFALSHTWIFPLLLLLLSVYEERYSRRYQSLLIGMLVWVAAQIHFYYFGLCALFLGLYTAYHLLRDRSLRNWRVRLSHLVVMVLVPFALLNIWVHWSDFATDRPASPFGFLHYLGEWEGVFLPYESFPMYKWIDQHIIHIRRVNGETQAYAGAIAFLFTFWLLLSGFRMFGKTWDEAAYHRVHKNYLRGIFTAALVLLLFACGFPYAIKGMEWMVDYMGPLRQFRSQGRFTWAYFYVINILAFYVFWNWSTRFKGFKNGQAPWFRWVIALAPVLLLAYEAYTYQGTLQSHTVDNLERREVAAPTPEHWLNKVDFSPYQALLPLPYYHMGSENLWWEFEFWQFIRMQTTAIHTGKPDMGVNMSRTSCSQLISSAQFVLEPTTIPTMLNELPDNRPLAVMVDPAKWEEVRQRYPHLIRSAKLVYEGPEMKILSLLPDSVRAYAAEHIRSVEQERLSRPLQKQSIFQVSGPLSPLLYQSYDSLQAPKVFRGKGAYTGNMGDTTWIRKDPMPPGQYVFSCWMYANQDLGMNHEWKFYELDPNDGHEIQFRHEGARFHLKTIVNNWGLFEWRFEVKGNYNPCKFFFLKRHADQPFILDEILIKPLDGDVYRRESGWVMRNNYWYKLE